MTFYSSMDGFTNTTTRIVSTVVLVVSLYLLYLILSGNNMAALGTLVFLHILFLFAYFSISGKYTVGNNRLQIKSVLFTVSIRLDEIQDAWIAIGEKDPLMRVAAFGGVFGYAGVFFSKALGRVNVFGRRLNGERLVLTMTNGKTYVLFPDEPDTMLYELERAADNPV